MFLGTTSMISNALSLRMHRHAGAPEQDLPIPPPPVRKQKATEAFQAPENC